MNPKYPFIVILLSQHGYPVPLVREGDWAGVAETFQTTEAASEAAKKTTLGEHFGFVVLDMREESR